MAGSEKEGSTPKGLMPKVLIAMVVALICAGLLMWQWSRTTGQLATPGAEPPAHNSTSPAT